MGEIERQFDYKEDAGMVRLLGVLCIILGPVSLWMSFQDTGPDSMAWAFFRGWPIPIPGPLVTPLMRVFSVVLVWIGYQMIKSAGKMKKFGGRIAFTKTGLIMEAEPPVGDSKETAYQDISKVQVSERKGKKSLTFWRADHNKLPIVGNQRLLGLNELRETYNYKLLIKASQMKSPAEFDEMAAMLAERVQANRSDGVTTGG